VNPPSSREEDQSKHKASSTDFDAEIIRLQQSQAAATGDFSEIVRYAIERASTLLGLASASLWIKDDEAQRLVCKDMYEPARALHSTGGTTPLESIKTHWDRLTNVRTLASSPNGLNSLFGNPASPFEYRPGGANLYAPMRRRGEVEGLLWFAATTPDRQWSPDERQFATAIADTIATTLEVFNSCNSHDHLEATHDRYLDLIDNAADVIYVHDLQGKFITLNSTAEELLGYPRHQLYTMNALDLIAPEHHEPVKTVLRQLTAGRSTPDIFEIELLRQDGAHVPVEINAWPVYRNKEPIAVQGIARDIRERRAAETTRITLERQLQQAQRLESVGRLAGGIAHDFNNILTAILGSSELVFNALEEDNPLRRRVGEVIKASERAATLTRQLLAFSRKQVMQPKLLDINATVREMDSLLRRIIGEDVHLCTELTPGPQHINADPAQIEQVIVNLAVNARDAMPDGGALTITTEPSQLEGHEGEGGFAVTPGAYVLLTIGDTGHGMDSKTKAHAFEPFFTTKGRDGKGTGLGLSTVFGIVKQSGGYIMIDSKKGEGARFRLYFPAVEAQERRPTPTTEPASEPPKGSETILIAEDDDVLRDLAKHILSRYGYNVIAAANGSEALTVSDQCSDTIDLLLTDVVMPNMGGKELADELTGRRAKIKILFMSGYADESVLPDSVIQSDKCFLQKPFTPVALVKKVRRILDGN